VARRPFHDKRHITAEDGQPFEREPGVERCGVDVEPAVHLPSARRQPALAERIGVRDRVDSEKAVVAEPDLRHPSCELDRIG